MLLLGNDLLEDSPYEPVNSRLSDIFRVVPFMPGKQISSSTLMSLLACNLLACVLFGSQIVHKEENVDWEIYQCSEKLEIG